MKSSVINDILKVEDAADKIVSDAEDKAFKMLAEAKSEARRNTEAELNRLKDEHNIQLEKLNKDLSDRLSSYEEETAKVQKDQIRISPEDLKRITDEVIKVLEG